MNYVNQISVSKCLDFRKLISTLNPQQQKTSGAIFLWKIIFTQRQLRMKKTEPMSWTFLLA